MTRLLCITPNPALDRTLTVPGLRPGGVFRTADVLMAPGGKGLNVARAAGHIGAEALIAAPLAGHTGQWVAELAESEGLRGAWTWIDGETRTCTILVAENSATVVNEVGTALAPALWAQFQADVLGHVEEVDSVCVSGSFPPGISADDCAAFIRALVESGKPVWIDSSGMALRAALDCGGMHIKVNGDELGAALGITVDGVETALEAAARTQQRTGAAAVVTLGKLGAVMASGEGRYVAQPPNMQIVSDVGSGDSFLAALAAAGPTSEGLRRAVAAGTANALQIGGGKFSREDFERVLARTTVADRSQRR